MANGTGAKLQAVSGNNAANGAENGTSDIAAPASRKRFVLLAILIALLSGVGVWMVTGGGKEWVATQLEPKPPEPVFVALESMTVNLQPENGDRYLQIGIVLKSYDKDTDGLVKMIMPDLRSRILMLLSSKTPAELYQASGKQALIKEILTLTRQPYSATIKDLKVKEVLFTNFVIQ